LTSSDFEGVFADRLKRIYRLKRKPNGPDDFFRLLKAESAKHLGTQKFIEQVRSKKAVIGKSEIPTKDWIVQHGTRERVFTFCSYDTLMTAVLQGGGEVGSSCPHCGAKMSVQILGGKLEGFSPKGMVFLWGAGPEGAPGNPMCDHLHLFPNRRHMDAWIDSKEGEMGFSFEPQDLLLRLKERF
jgi:alkylmercury lyase-like protein